MNTEQKIIKNKVGLLKLAETLGNIGVVHVVPSSNGCLATPILTSAA